MASEFDIMGLMLLRRETRNFRLSIYTYTKDNKTKDKGKDIRFSHFFQSQNLKNQERKTQIIKILKAFNDRCVQALKVCVG